jgi:hypothetical protein
MIHLYPGMGATARMYAPPWNELDGVTFHDWPTWKGESEIADFAKRLIVEHRIVDGDCAAGSSLGGIVASEIGSHVRLRTVILIGSAARKEEIHRLISALRPLFPLAPLPFLKALSGKIPNDLTRMFSNSDPAFIKAMAAAIFRWNGLTDNVPRFRIHGRKDRIIPRPPGVDHLIEGGHLIAMTHARECVEAIREHLAPERAK